MLKSFFLNLIFFTYPFYLLIDGDILKKVNEYGKVLLIILLIVIIDNGIYNLKRASKN